MHHNEPRSFFKQLVTIAHVEVHASAAFAVFIDVLRQQKCRRISTLAADVIRDLIHFGSIHERTLYTGKVASHDQQHVATSNKLISPAGVQYCPRVYLGEHAESKTGREVSLNRTCDNIDGRALRRDNQVYPDSPRQLG